jgi:Phage integrase family
VFTREHGTPIRPGWASARFTALTAGAALPPIRFHDLRHGTATMLLAAGQPIKVISERLKHAHIGLHCRCLHRGRRGAGRGGYGRDRRLHPADISLGKCGNPARFHPAGRLGAGPEVPQRVVGDLPGAQPRMIT